MHQPGPAAEGGAIHGEDAEGVAYPIQPLLDLSGLGGVLLPAELDAGLDFADGHTGEVQIGGVNALEPVQHAAVGAWPA